MLNNNLLFRVGQGVSESIEIKDKLLHISGNT